MHIPPWYWFRMTGPTPHLRVRGDRMPRRPGAAGWRPPRRTGEDQTPSRQTRGRITGNLLSRRTLPSTETPLDNGITKKNSAALSKSRPPILCSKRAIFVDNGAELPIIHVIHGLSRKKIRSFIYARAENIIRPTKKFPRAGGRADHEYKGGLFHRGAAELPGTPPQRRLWRPRPGGKAEESARMTTFRGGKAPLGG